MILENNVAFMVPSLRVHIDGKIMVNDKPKTKWLKWVPSKAVKWVLDIMSYSYFVWKRW